MQNPLPTHIYESRKIPKSHPIRGEFFRDQTAIIHSMPFRRLKHKTQVFFSPENDHVCTRIEHVLHVATIGATICKGLNNFGWNLNPEMAYAIGLGHDLGHAPFGHSGENALSRKLSGKRSFIHEIHSLRVADKLCNSGKGLNLTYGVRDGIINHNGEILQQQLKPTPNINPLETMTDRLYIASSYEGCITRFSDKIAYLGRDIEDALIAEFISINQLPEIIREAVGSTNGEIINHLILDVINTSKNSDVIQLSDKMFEKVSILQKFNYQYIYQHPIINTYSEKCEKILEELFDFLHSTLICYQNNYEKYQQDKIDLVKHFGNNLQEYEQLYKTEGWDTETIVCDFIAGMTDNYALNAYKEMRLPKSITFTH
ncbi:MAG: HD domain-containing protein [Bacteroidales bacterium]|nr:HD domain-containing protein [Bacteroidales bacterium]